MMLYDIMLWYGMLCDVMSCYGMLCYAALYCIILYYVIVYYIILYYIISYCIISYYIVWCYIILYYMYMCVYLSLYIYIYIYNVIAWDVKVAMAPLGPGGAAARPDGPGPCPFLQDLYILMIKSIFQITIYSSWVLVDYTYYDYTHNDVWPRPSPPSPPRWPRRRPREARRRRRGVWRARAPPRTQGFQGYGFSILRIRYLVPRMLFVLCCF